MSNLKIKKRHIDHKFGFPVQIVDAPFEKIGAKWALALNFEEYESVTLSALARKPARLSGNEIKFIRRKFKMGLASFGRRFGSVAHSAVIKWEKFGNTPTNMNWATEKDIRLAIVKKVKPILLSKSYDGLNEEVPKKIQKIEIHASLDFSKKARKIEVIT